MRLITMEMAKSHMRLGSGDLPADTESDLRMKIEQAEALVLDYVDQRLSDADAWSADVADWNVEGGSPSLTVPPQVQAAVLVQLLELWRFRGDDNDSDHPKRDLGTLHPMAVAYLYRLRDPAIA